MNKTTKKYPAWISPIEREVDQIRLGIYEETKHMTPAEHTEYYNKSGRELAKQYGFKILQ
jgi:hypothetical protein